MTWHLRPTSNDMSSMLVPLLGFSDTVFFKGVQESRGGLEESVPGAEGVDGFLSLGTLVTKMSTWRAEPGTRAIHLLTIEAHHEI